MSQNLQTPFVKPHSAIGIRQARIWSRESSVRVCVTLYEHITPGLIYAGNLHCLNRVEALLTSSDVVTVPSSTCAATMVSQDVMSRSSRSSRRSVGLSELGISVGLGDLKIVGRVGQRREWTVRVRHVNKPLRSLL